MNKAKQYELVSNHIAKPISRESLGVIMAKIPNENPKKISRKKRVNN